LTRTTIRVALPTRCSQELIQCYNEESVWHNADHHTCYGGFFNDLYGFCHCDKFMHVDRSNIRLVRCRRIQSSFAVPTGPFTKKHNLHTFLADARILLASWCLGAMQPTDMSTYLVRVRCVSTSSMCETVDSLHATVETHKKIFHYV
jgi:hypothetical protein